jgi:hypothetical protein
MKTAFFIILGVIMGLTSALASEVEILEGQKAFELYLSLPGARCTEWNSADFVVYTKYQTATCEESSDNSKWTCTIQINKKNNLNNFESANCSREVNN